MGKKTEQPDFKNETSIEPEVEATLDRKTAAEEQAAATLARDMTLLCDNCKGRLQRAHEGDERARNSVYPEGTPAA